METYLTRVIQFFLQSIHTLKKESGGQRWNEICNATAELALVKSPFSICFGKEELWSLFFHPPQTLEESPILLYFSTQEKFPQFLFLLLQALTDPPSSWWRTQFL